MLQIARLDRDAGLKADVRGRVAFLEEAPASRFEQLIDLDASGGFFTGHSGCDSTDSGQAA